MTLLVVCFKRERKIFSNFPFILLQNRTVTAHTSRKVMSQVSKAETACAACKFQKKKCSEKCVLAPYFPQNDPNKFLLVHRLFGNGHVVKLLQDLPAEQRGDAVSSLVYEARARAADPVHGCAGVINDLQQRIEEVQAQLAFTQAKLDNITVQHSNILITLNNTRYHQGWDPNFYSPSPQASQDTQYTNPPILDDEVDSLQLWET